MSITLPTPVSASVPASVPASGPRVRPVPVVEPWPAARLAVNGPGEGAHRPRGQGVLPFVLPARAPLPGLAAAAEPRQARAWALSFTQAALEVLAGLRQPAQLVRWTTDDVQAALRRRYALARRHGAPAGPGIVRSVHVSHPVRGVAEVAAVVADRSRSRALAFRMEAGADGPAGRWRVTALELG